MADEGVPPHTKDRPGSMQNGDPSGRACRSESILGLLPKLSPSASGARVAVLYLQSDSFWQMAQ